MAINVMILFDVIYHLTYFIVNCCYLSYWTTCYYSLIFNFLLLYYHFLRILSNILILLHLIIIDYAINQSFIIIVKLYLASFLDEV